MWFFNAAIDHLNKNVGVFMELNHQLLTFLHLTECVFIYDVSIVEKEIILRCQLNLHVLNMIIVISLYKYELAIESLQELRF